jgi:hypothetical protein
VPDAKAVFAQVFATISGSYPYSSSQLVKLVPEVLSTTVHEPEKAKGSVGAVVFVLSVSLLELLPQPPDIPTARRANRAKLLIRASE